MKQIRWTIMLACLCLPAMVTGAEKEDTMDLSTEDAKISYALGLSVGGQLSQLVTDMKDAGMTLEVDTLLSGLRTQLEGGEPVLSMEEIEPVMQKFQETMQAAQQEKMQEQMQQQMQADKANPSPEAQENMDKGEAFLAENAKKEGVKVTDTGLQYEIIEEGTGDSPEADDQVKVHYKGVFIDGEQFDSSYDGGEPATFGVTQVIPGWTEALQMMKEGGKWKVYIPAELAYGPGRPGIPPYSVLIFDVELLEVLD